MKNIAIVLILLGLSACSNSPNTTQIGTESAATVILQKTPGLEGCSLYKFKVSEYDNSIHIVRCPGKESISVDHQYMQGKSQRQDTTILIDE